MTPDADDGIFVNDFYARFCNRNAPQTHYVFVARIVTGLQVFLGFAMLLIVKDVKSLFFVYTALGAGSGLVFIVRWYWWRVTAWSEITAMSVSFLMFLVFRLVFYPTEESFNAHAVQILLMSTPLVTLSWVLVSLCQRRTPETIERLKHFYRLARPSFGWRPIALAVERESGQPIRTDPILPGAVAWISCTVMIYTAIIGFGKVLLGSPGEGFVSLSLFTITLFVTIKAVRRITD